MRIYRKLLTQDGAEAFDDAIAVEGGVARVRIGGQGVNVPQHDQSAPVATQISDCSVPQIIQVAGNHVLLMSFELAQGSLKVFVLLLVIWPFAVAWNTIPSKLVIASESEMCSNGLTFRGLERLAQRGGRRLGVQSW